MRPLNTGAFFLMGVLMVLTVESLNKSYKTNNVLKNLSLEIGEKDLTALVGVNGSGKSTLIEIICGIKKKDGGTISFMDRDISDKKHSNEVKRQIGYMPQFFSMFNDLTVKENLRYLYSVYELNDLAVILRTIEKCGLKKEENTLVKNLSGGYRQLVSLAGAIIHNPKLLILDEPTSAMDPLFRKQFWDIIYACKSAGTAVLVTTHYAEEIFNCTKVLCLYNGSIIHKSDVANIYENGKFKSIHEVLDYYILKGMI